METPKQNTTVPIGDFHGVTRSRVTLQYLPRPDFYEFQIPLTHCILLTNDGSKLTQKVFSKLAANNQKVAVLNLPNVPNPIKVNAFDLPEISDFAIGEALQEIAKEHGAIGSFIHLHPHFEFQGGRFVQHFKTEREIVKAVFFLAKHLKLSLNELGEKQRVGFMSVTRLDGKLGQGKRGNISVIGGGLKGLIKCLNLEWSPVYCRAVDIQPELAVEVIADQVIAEFHDADLTYVETAFSEEGRKTTTAKKVQLTDNEQIKTTVSSDSVFLVSGGAKGVTAKCVVEMARCFQCKFILLGRSDFDYQVPAFAENFSSEGDLKRLIMEDMKARGEKPNLKEVRRIFKNITAKKEIEDTLNKVKSHGAQAIYIKGDVTNAASFSTQLKAAEKQLGKITGAMHGAGRLADKYIQDKSEADFENVLSVKLDGLLSLFQSVDIHNLDHLILFSSVAGFYGNIGQSDYAIANEILSQAAHLFKTNHPNTHVTAINWGAWDSGMVTGELKAQFEAHGVELVNSEGGPALLVNELRQEYFEEPQCIIGGTLPAARSYIGEKRNHRVIRTVKLEENPFLHHHVIQGKPVMPVVNAISWTAQTCHNLYPDYKIFRVFETKLFKGLVFDGNEKEIYLSEVEELEKTEDEITFNVVVSSQDEGRKLPTYHYKSKVTIRHKNNIPPKPKFHPTNSGKYEPTDGSILYQDGTLFHGKYFQGIEKLLDASEKQLIMQCNSPVVPDKDQGQFSARKVNPFYSDIHYQGIVVWVKMFKDGAKGLPVSTRSVTLYENIPFEKRLFCTIEVEEADDYKMVATCRVFDEDNNLFMQTEGATLTISKDLQW